MKKLVLTVALAISSLVAFANLQKPSLASYNKYFQLSETTAQADSLSTKGNTLELSKIAFYDVDRIVIENNNKKYIKVVSENGKLIVESHDSVDIKVTPGTYYVYTTSKKLVGLYK